MVMLFYMHENTKQKRKCETSRIPKTNQQCCYQEVRKDQERVSYENVPEHAKPCHRRTKKQKPLVFWKGFIAPRRLLPLGESKQFLSLIICRLGRSKILSQINPEHQSYQPRAWLRSRQYGMAHPQRELTPDYEMGTLST